MELERGLLEVVCEERDFHLEEAPRTPVAEWNDTRRSCLWFIPAVLALIAVGFVFTS